MTRVAPTRAASEVSLVTATKILWARPTAAVNVPARIAVREPYDEGPVDQSVDVVQAVARDRDSDRDRHRGEEEQPCPETEIRDRAKRCDRHHEAPRGEDRYEGQPADLRGFDGSARR